MRRNCCADGKTPLTGCAADRVLEAGPRSLLVCNESAATYERASDEHGSLAVSAATNLFGVCDKIRLIPDHCYWENRGDPSGSGIDTEKTNGEPTPPAITSFSP